MPFVYLPEAALRREVLYTEFDLSHALDAPALLDQYVFFFNNQRRHAVLDYKSPV